MDVADRLKFIQKFEGVLAGTDEAGCGPLAGPVMAAAVILTREQEKTLLDMGLKDSKRVSPQKRIRLFDAMCAMQVCWSAQAAGLERIARLNIRGASLWAMGRSVEKLDTSPDLVVVDGLHPLPGIPFRQLPLVAADDVIPAVSAASVVAKVLRDRVMEALDPFFPEYGLAKHKGYPTKQHRRALLAFGISEAHRVAYCERLIQKVKVLDHLEEAGHGSNIQS